MLVKSVACKSDQSTSHLYWRLPFLQIAGSGVPPQNQIWNCFQQSALSIFPYSQLQGTQQNQLQERNKKKKCRWPCTWPAFRPHKGVWGDGRKTKPKGSRIHVTINESFISNKDAQSSAQPSICHFTSVVLEVPETTSNWVGSKVSSGSGIVTHHPQQQRRQAQGYTSAFCHLPLAQRGEWVCPKNQPKAHSQDFNLEGPLSGSPNRRSLTCWYFQFSRLATESSCDHIQRIYFPK